MCIICSTLRPYQPDCDYAEFTDFPLLASYTETTDAPSTPSTMYVINPGDSFAGTYSNGSDVDVIAVNVVAGQTYTVSLTGIANATNPAPDTYLRILNGNGTVIHFDDDGGPGYNSQITFTATTTGYHYIQVSQFGVSSGTGTDSGVAGSYAVGVAVGTTPLPPPAPSGQVASIQDMATYLTQGYWASTGYNGAPRAFDVAPGGTLYVDIRGLTADGQRLALQALDAWTQVTGINFSTQIPAGRTAHITFDDNQSGAFASFQTMATSSPRHLSTFLPHGWQTMAPGCLAIASRPMCTKSAMPLAWVTPEPTTALRFTVGTRPL
ncbi:MAG: PPC domain-containing protein [Pseudotabrizicola sp.]|uniref:PPC domain-containing protein n=1 Tax=Pseudotabrizicola sp. TaxID=2939647 RepID=UPI002731440D|nr:PPC domain-containing protein [Pseudotabrizicola sp.]MDP2080620.1 PPC domain-containing protein [Pseudotabrizicola sp.]MDZ7573349.1 PPC domain-containing protein [Pseudotabrizicola sp.]